MRSAVSPVSLERSFSAHGLDDSLPMARAFRLPGHNITFAALGVFILWVGWYGFNPGSQLAFQSPGDIDATVLIAVNTTLAAAAGVVRGDFDWLGLVRQARPDDGPERCSGRIGWHHRLL